ncbi:MAG: acetate/propionate family kinase [Nanoarchaeota archaeon]|nr:acetate/propionate family kinase [Nanoarchaeota archaeon]
MNILILNVGSSSIKYSLFSNKNLVFKKEIDKIGLKGTYFKDGDKKKLVNVKNFSDGVDFILNDIKNYKIELVGHRVVHGGDINKPSLINDKLIKELKKVAKLAPLHDFPEIKVIELFRKLKVKQYSVFDTMFFKNLPEKAKIYGIPYKLTKKYNIRRYGFHGESHKYLNERVSKILNKKNLKLITLHLGNGCSVSAIKNGKPIDTSMGFTPLEGLVMGTRCGDLDPAIVTFLMEHEKLSYKDIYKILNEKSGLLGISEVSRNVPELLKNKKGKLALDIFVYKVIKYIGSYYAALKGVDTIVFSGGIGENEYVIRKRILDELKFLGIKINDKLNKKNNLIISDKNSKIKVFVIKTNEEEIIVKNILKVVKK